MKIFILCGGFGTRLDYEGTLKAKPMVRIGQQPILKHLLDNFYNQGFNEFVLCMGHKSESIINYFLKENKKNTKVLINKKKYLKIKFNKQKKKFLIDLIYTGKNSGTGGRIKTAYKMLNLNEDIFMTYGDGLSDVKIKKIIDFHYRKKSLTTLTAVKAKQRYGILKINNNRISHFDNSKKKVETYINGGFFVISKKAIDFINNRKTYWENEPIKKVQRMKKLFAFKHNGFWHSMDTMKDKNDLNELYKKKKFLWKVKKLN